MLWMYGADQNIWQSMAASEPVNNQKSLPRKRLLGPPTTIHSRIPTLQLTFIIGMASFSASNWNCKNSILQETPRLLFGNITTQFDNKSVVCQIFTRFSFVKWGIFVFPWYRITNSISFEWRKEQTTSDARWQKCSDRALLFLWQMEFSFFPFLFWFFYYFCVNLAGNWERREQFSYSVTLEYNLPAESWLRNIIESIVSVWKYRFSGS